MEKGKFFSEGKKPLFIPGMDATVVFLELKSKYGVRQSKIAEVLGVSRQVISDMKAGKRRFSDEMFRKLILAFEPEPWSGWLARTFFFAFKRHFNYMNEGELARHLDGWRPDGFFAREEIPDGATRTNPPESPPHPAKVSTYPVLSAPVVGDPEGFPELTLGRLALPPPLAAQAADFLHPYILRLDFDDVRGRFRRGDWILIVQDAEREAEVLLVRFRGEARLARRGRRYRSLTNLDRSGIRDDDLIALDSGKRIEAERIVGCAVGIVLALL